MNETQCFFDLPLKFVNRKDDITGDDDPNTQRMEMSCGHAVTSESLTAWCRSLLDRGQYKFTCPALKDGTNEICGAEWRYVEVRRLALLTDEEQKDFEEKMAAMAAADYCENSLCPGCKSSVERQDLTNLCVKCTICTAETGKQYEFCWQCKNIWRGPAPRSDKCDNSNCKNQKIDNLQNCREITLPSVQNTRVPSLRACPTCGNVVEHDTTGCKNVICNRCQIEFCFCCLKLTPCSGPGSHYTPCVVAPRQTAIPVWKK